MIRRDNEMKMIDSTTEYGRLDSYPKSQNFFRFIYLKYNFRRLLIRRLLVQRFVFVRVSPCRFIDFYHRWRTKN